MAKINMEQRCYIQTQFFNALSDRTKASAPKALIGKKVKITQTQVIEMGLCVNEYRNHQPVYIRTESRGDAKVSPNKDYEAMLAAVKAGEAMYKKGAKLWEGIEAEMILGSDDIKQVLADALAKVAKL